MKTLQEYIKDSIYESSSDSYKLSFDGIDGGAAMLETIKSLCQTHVPNVNYMSGQNTDINININKDNLETVQKIIDNVNDFISDIPNDEHDNIATQLNELTEQVDAIQSKIDELSNEEDNDENDTDDTKDDSNDDNKNVANKNVENKNVENKNKEE